MDDALGGGPLIDGAVHNYDFANWLFGDPEQVLASTLKLNQGVTAVDTGSTIVRYAGGNQLLLSWSWYNKGGSLNDILGSKANMFFGNGSVTPPAEDKDQYSYFCVQPVGEPAYLVKATKNFNNMYVNQARHFIACVRGQEVCRTPGEEAIKAVAVAETIFAVGPQGGCAAVRW
jgi:predicted dehydrogenase